MMTQPLQFFSPLFHSYSPALFFFLFRSLIASTPPRNFFSSFSQASKHQWHRRSHPRTVGVGGASGVLRLLALEFLEAQTVRAEREQASVEATEHEDKNNKSSRRPHIRGDRGTWCLRQGCYGVHCPPISLGIGRADTEIGTLRERYGLVCCAEERARLAWPRISSQAKGREFI